ncbi:MAG TPA: helix-turn-helix domain-containing protein [Pseudolabrys sp.]|nr:helix-turn-helix domain-containing protein [Pseudolabrys sp.]
MFALMNSWDKSPGESLTIEHHPLRGGTYTLTDYLGLTLETVSRALSSLRKRGLIRFTVSVR